jgi:hypothetical protein
MALSYVQASEPENWSDRDANGIWDHVPPPDSLWVVAISEKQDLRFCNNKLLSDLALNVRIQEGRPASNKSTHYDCVCACICHTMPSRLKPVCVDTRSCTGVCIKFFGD